MAKFRRPNHTHGGGLSQRGGQVPRSPQTLKITRKQPLPFKAP